MKSSNVESYSSRLRWTCNIDDAPNPRQKFRVGSVCQDMGDTGGRNMGQCRWTSIHELGFTSMHSEKASVAGGEPGGGGSGCCSTWPPGGGGRNSLTASRKIAFSSS